MAAHTSPTALASSKLFSPLKVGNYTLKHRVVMAPMGRLRARELSPGEWVVDDLVAEYYGQRASDGGMQITESTPISRMAAGYPRIAGIFTDAQVEAWKKVTGAIHAKGGLVFSQIWHAGRASIPEYLNGEPTVSSSAVPLPGNFIGPGPKEYVSTIPRALSEQDISSIIQDFARAAERAVVAGFDGVEIHGANGYLIEQFLHDNINNRNDAYGGSLERRCRIVFDVIEAVTKAIGPGKTGIRLSPFNYWHGTRDSNPMAHWVYLCERLADMSPNNRPSYVSMIEPRFDEILSEASKLESLAARDSNGEPSGDAPETGVLQPSDYSLYPFREALKKGGINLFAAGNYNRDNALPALDSDRADAIIFGRPFISNPDLPLRLANGYEMVEPDRTTFYGATPPAKGFTDYPFHRTEPASEPIAASG